MFDKKNVPGEIIITFVIMVFVMTIIELVDGGEMSLIVNPFKLIGITLTASTISVFIINWFTNRKKENMDV